MRPSSASPGRRADHLARTADLGAGHGWPRPGRGARRADAVAIEGHGHAARAAVKSSTSSRPASTRPPGDGGGAVAHGPDDGAGLTDLGCRCERLEPRPGGVDARRSTSSASVVDYCRTISSWVVRAPDALGAVVRRRRRENRVRAAQSPSWKLWPIRACGKRSSAPATSASSRTKSGFTVPPKCAPRANRTAASLAASSSAGAVATWIASAGGDLAAQCGEPALGRRVEALVDAIEEGARDRRAAHLAEQAFGRWSAARSRVASVSCPAATLRSSASVPRAASRLSDRPARASGEHLLPVLRERRRRPRRARARASSIDRQDVGLVGGAALLGGFVARPDRRQRRRRSLSGAGRSSLARTGFHR